MGHLTITPIAPESRGWLSRRAAGLGLPAFLGEARMAIVDAAIRKPCTAVAKALPPGKCWLPDRDVYGLVAVR